MTVLNEVSNVFLTGSATADSLEGGAGNDTLAGLGSADRLTGGAGNDALIGGAGADTLDGGTGIDSVLYYRDGGQQGIVADLGTGMVQDSFGEIDTLVSIERLYGTDFADTINGGDAAEFLAGGSGDDSIDGRGGDDTLIGHDGNDTLTGGTGLDQVAYYIEAGGNGVVVNLQTGTATDTWGATDRLVSIERVDGSAFGDTLIGSDAIGEWLFGQDGNDSLNSGAGNDTLVGGAGRDTLVGGAGEDQLSYSHESGTFGVLVNLETGAATDSYGSADSVSGFERVYGTGYGDTLIGSDSRGDYLFGRDGNDSILGGANGGIDSLIGDAGNDTLDGGAGIDQVMYFLETGSLGAVVDLAAGTARDTWGNTDTLRNIEYVLGSNNGDTLLGSSTPDERFFGEGGNDYIDGRDGNNLIFSGDGNDTIVVGTTIADTRDTIVIDGTGTKTILGGRAATAYDHHIVFEIDEAVTVNLATGIATSASMRTDFSAALHFLEVGGTMHDDLLIGGNAAHDYLEWFCGNQGNDTLNGGSGTGDTVIYDSEVEVGSFNFDLGRREVGTQGCVVNLQTGVATDTFGDTDTLINIDAVRATRYGDQLTGSTENNAFWGLAGSDTIDGGAGSDRIHYGEDSVTGGIAGVTVNLQTGVAIDGFGAHDLLTSIEEVYATDQADWVLGGAEANRLFGYLGNDTLSGATGADVILGGGGDDSILGGADNDELWGEAGNDTIDGGTGTDIVRYVDDVSGIVADLSAGTVRDGSGAQDTLIGVEWLHASRHADWVRGDAQTNQILGYEGNDTLDGAEGNDTIVAGAGDDSVLGGSGDDELWGEAGNDTIDGGEGADAVRYLSAAAGITADLGDGTVLDGMDGTDLLISVEGLYGSGFADRMTGSQGADSLRGMAGNDTLMGGGSNDLLMGGEGDDWLEGSEGDDELWGEAGNDTIDGGEGVDTLRYVTSTAGVVVSLATGLASDGLGGTDLLNGVENLNGSQLGDWLRGSDLANRLLGYSGADTILGGVGNDTLSGGADADTYVFFANDGQDNVNDLGGAAGADGSDRVIFRDYLPHHARIYQQAGTSNIVFEFGTNAAGQIERVVLTASADAASASAIELIEWADGTVWSLDTLLGYLGQMGSPISRLATEADDILAGTVLADTLSGLGGDDILDSHEGNDLLNGGLGNDLLRGGDGNDTLVGSGGNDRLFGGESLLDLRDLIYGGEGNDTIDGGYGNDELRGDAGNDLIEGGFGSDTLIGGTENDTLSGSALSDQLFGGDGADYLNGGFGHDRMNGGAGADRFFHIGVAGHGSDWIQDYSAAAGDVLVFGNASATRSQFQINWATTNGAGDGAVQEAFVVYRPTGQIIWALVDGAANDHIWLQIGANSYDLLA